MVKVTTTMISAVILRGLLVSGAQSVLVTLKEPQLAAEPFGQRRLDG